MSALQLYFRLITRGMLWPQRRHTLRRFMRQQPPPPLSPAAYQRQDWLPLTASLFQAVHSRTHLRQVRSSREMWASGRRVQQPHCISFLLPLTWQNFYVRGEEEQVLLLLKGREIG